MSMRPDLQHNELTLASRKNRINVALSPRLRHIAAAVAAVLMAQPTLAANTITFDTVTATFPTVSTFLPISSQVLTFSGPTAARTITLPDADFTAASRAGTETLTNKTLTQPTLTLKQSAGATPTALGEIQYDTTSKRIVTGNGTSTDTILGTGTLTDGRLCSYDATGVRIVCNTVGGGGGTVTNTGGSLTSNAIVLGAGTSDTKVTTGITTDGTSALNLGVAGTSVGKVVLANATSGTITMQPPTGALGTVTVTVPAATDTLVNLAGAQTLTNKTINGSNNTISNITGSMMTGNTVTSTQLAVVLTRRVCDIAVGDTSGSALTNAQLGPQKRICFIPAAATVVEVNVAADAGTPNVIVAKNSAGTVSNLVSSALATAGSGGIACSKTTATTGINGATTCSATLQNTSLAAGDYIELVSGTAGGTAKFMTVHVVYTIN